MRDSAYNIISAFYESLSGFFPAYEGNPCEECNVCCKRIANLGVSEMEMDYVEEYLSREKPGPEYKERLRDFKRFIGETPDQKNGQTCPFFSEELKGCSIYAARPLSCRTFGCYLNRRYEGMVPDYCLIRDGITYYDDSDFAEKMPFVPDFYRMQQTYSAAKRSAQGDR